MKNSKIEKFFWKIVEKLARLLALWYARLKNWHAFGTLARWQVKMRSWHAFGILARGHEDQAHTHDTQDTRFSKLQTQYLSSSSAYIWYSFLIQEFISKLCKFSKLSNYAPTFETFHLEIGSVRKNFRINGYWINFCRSCVKAYVDCIWKKKYIR